MRTTKLKMAVIALTIIGLTILLTSQTNYTSSNGEGSITIDSINVENNFPQTFDEAEAALDNQFQDIKIDTESPYMLVTSEGDTTYHNMGVVEI